MIDGIYIAASGGAKQERSLEVISNNLANINTTGFKKDVLAFKSFLPPFPNSSEQVSAPSGSKTTGSQESFSYAGIVELKSDLSQGGLVNTENPLDVALEGEGFFAIETQEGVRYTRQGNFRLNEKRGLVTQDGNPVIGSTGPITIPAGQVLSIDTTGKISVGNGLGNTVVDSMKIVNFDDPGKLVKTGNGLFMLTGNESTEINAENFSVRQGFIESSNVNAVEEMTKMIEVMRTYQAYQKAIQTIDSANSKAATELGRLA